MQFFLKFFLENFLKRWMANRPPCLGMAEGGRWMRGYGASPHGGGAPMTPSIATCHFVMLRLSSCRCSCRSVWLLTYRP